jgi:aminoglycoside 6'-N-acetyltransferase I
MPVIAYDPKHSETWADLRAKLWPKSQRAVLAKEAKEFKQKPEFEVFLAQDGNTICGFLEIWIRPFVNGAEHRPAAHVEAFYVLPEYRHKKFGRALMEHAENWVRGKGLKEITSDVAMDNAFGLAAHGRLGFLETERVVYFRKAL